MKRILHDQQNVYIQGERLRGVQSCQAGWVNDESYVNAIGYEGGYVGSVTNGPMAGEFSVNRSMVSHHDPLIDLFESEDLSGEISYKDQDFSFNGGYINSYSCSCAVGEIPSLNFGITAYKNTGGSVASLGKGAETDDAFVVATPGSIILNVNGYTTNAIQSFDFSITINRQPFQLIGDMQPVHFLIEYPIEINCEFVMTVSDYQARNLFDSICSPEAQDLNFIFRDCDSNQEIRKFIVPDAKIVEYNQNSEVNQSLEATLTYKALCTNINKIKNILNP